MTVPAFVFPLGPVMIAPSMDKATPMARSIAPIHVSGVIPPYRPRPGAHGLMARNAAAQPVTTGAVATWNAAPAAAAATVSAISVKTESALVITIRRQRAVRARGVLAPAATAGATAACNAARGPKQELVLPIAAQVEAVSPRPTKTRRAAMPAVVRPVTIATKAPAILLLACPTAPTISADLMIAAECALAHRANLTAARRRAVTYVCQRMACAQSRNPNLFLKKISGLQATYDAHK